MIGQACAGVCMKCATAPLKADHCFAPCHLAAAAVYTNILLILSTNYPMNALQFFERWYDIPLRPIT